MDNSRTFTGLIKEIVRSAVKYIRHYIGEVADNEDPLKLGRVLIIIQELRWDTKDKGSWAFPRDKHSMSVPKIGDWVEMYFINGDPNLPVYLGIANEIKDMIPENYTGNVKEHILFESPDNVQKIVYNEDDNLLSIGEGEESFVLGDTLKTELQNNVDALIALQLDFGTWTPVPNDGGLALKTILSAGFLTETIASLTNILSERIKGE